METTQKSNKITPEKRIEQIWKENLKIPFMQSKEILALGFNKGMEYCDDNPKPQQVNNKPETKKEKQVTGIVGNSKETIIYNEQQIKLTDIEKETIKLNIVEEILCFITENRDLMKTYTKVKDMKSSINECIKNLQKKNSQIL